MYDIEIENPTTRNDIYSYCCVAKKDKNGSQIYKYYDQNNDEIVGCDIFDIAKLFCHGNDIYDTMRVIESMVF